MYNTHVHGYCTTGKYIEGLLTLDQRTEFNAHKGAFVAFTLDSGFE